MRFWAIFSLFVFLPFLAQASTTFNVSPTSVSYGFGTQISWNSSDGTAPAFYFSCIPGITIQSNNGLIPCGTVTIFSQNTSDIVGISVLNVSGSVQPVTIRMVPRDATGAEISESTQTVTLSSAPVAQPILDFYSSSTTPASGAPVTFTWKGQEITGVNIQFNCVSDVVVLSDSANPLSALQCGQPAFSSDLAQSGSQTVTFVNNSLFPQQVNVRIFPAIVPGSYDGTHGMSATLYVQGKVPTQDPSVSSFSISSASPVPASPVTLSWTVLHADKANVQFSCASGISLFSGAGASSTPLTCGVIAFAQDFATSASTTVSFANSGVLSVPVSVLLLPKVGSVYDATHGRSLSFSVQVPGAAATNYYPTPVPAPAPATPVPGVPQTGQIKAVHTITFTLSMQKGSRGSQVSALQQFLAQDASFYPEGLVTGYFGVGTDAALKRFQVRYGIAKAGDDGYGSVGPKTRAKLNSLTYF